MNPSPARVRPRLLRWFDTHRRDLPWRTNRDPYAIWVSEVMLQQTTVATVTSRFQPFLDRFPNLESLATADEADVLRQWQGLGYYRRARNLHRAAQTIVAEHGGIIPDELEVWLSLPGVGRYIAGAVLSQAFERRVPIVDTNVQRVLCRLYGKDGDPKTSAINAWLWSTANGLLPRKRVGDFNQGLMELGALVCTPTEPKCDTCPLQRECVARAKGTQSELPSRGKPIKITELQEVTVVVRDGDRVLVGQRAVNVRWANMWEFPNIEPDPCEPIDLTASRLVREKLKLDVSDIRPLDLTIKYAVTRYRTTMTCYEGIYRAGEPLFMCYTHMKWVKLTELEILPMSSPQRRLVAALSKSQRQLRLF